MHLRAQPRDGLRFPRWLHSHRIALVSTSCLVVNLAFVAVFEIPETDLTEQYPPLSHKLIAAAILICANVAAAIFEATTWLSVMSVALAAINVAVSILVLTAVACGVTVLVS